MMENRRLAFAVAALFAGLLTACSSEVANVAGPDLKPRLVQSETGNGSQSGFHYTLNLIGMEKGKTADMNATGSAMFVKLDRTGALVTTKIMLIESLTGEYAITDKDGTDGVAGFTLPAPVNGDGDAAYQIYARAVGTPGGSAKLITCAEDVTGNGATTDEVCDVDTDNTVYTHDGRPRFANVTAELTSILILESTEEAAFLACGGTDTLDNTGSITVRLFDSCLENYFWKYDNQGVRILQIRIYPLDR